MKLQKIISAFAVTFVVILHILFVPQTVYSDTVGFYTAKKLSALGILYTVDNLNDIELSKFLEEKTTKTVAYLSAIGFTGTKRHLNTDFTYDDISLRFYKSDNIDAYNNTVEAIDYISSSFITSEDCYRLLLEILGYGSLKDKSNSEVLNLAIQSGFGYMQPVVATETITNGILCNILFEALYINGYNTGIPTIHTLSRVNPDFINKAKELQMIDLFPETIPMFTEGSFKEGSFTELSGTDVTSSIAKSEWSALYLNVKKDGYERYKEKLVNRDWLFEIEFTKETDNKKELCILYYKLINNKEQYITLVFNEESKTCELWYAY